MKPVKSFAPLVLIPIVAPTLVVIAPPSGNPKKNSTGPSTVEYRNNWAKIFGSEKPIYKG